MSLKIQRLLTRSNKLAKKGENEKARDLYSKILEADPNNHDAKKGLQLLKQKQNKQYLKSQLDDIMRLYSSGMFQESLSSINLLIKEYPNDSLLFNICGACFSEIGPIESAISSFEKAISIKPDYAEAHYNLGVAHQKVKQIDDALNCYVKATSIKHAYPQAHNNLGLIYMSQGHLNAAIKSLEWAVAYAPNYAEAFNNLGAALQEQMLFGEAMEQFEKAVNLNPNYTLALNNLGISFEIMGQKDKAIISYNQAISIDSGYAEVHRNLSAIKKYTSKDSQVEQMESLYLKKSLSHKDKTNLCFALAKVYEDLKNDNEFFKFLNEGNKLRKQQLKFSFEASQNLNSRLINITKSAPTLKSELANYNLTKRPIFIVGMPRSGSTLVEQIISSHPNVYGAGELNNFKKTINPFLDNLLKKDLNNNLSKKDLISIRQKYIESLSPFDIQEDIFTDKMLLNFEYIGLIVNAFPEAKIIHLKRDARAVCWSIYKSYFSVKGNGWAYDMTDIVNFYSLYVKTMDSWHKLFPNKIYDVSYEKLTVNQKVETEKLLKYCDLTWNDSCLNFHNNTRAVKTASSSQVRKKMYQGSSEAWRKYESYLQPLIKELKPY
jgi:tetratricopeptide (TPR) repeat protein